MTTRQVPKSSRDAWRRSSDLRAERARMHQHVLRRGVSLAVLLREHRPALEAVEVIRLVQWLPYVGPEKARALCRGLPHRYTIAMLSNQQRAHLTARVAAYETRQQQAAGSIPTQED